VADSSTEIIPDSLLEMDMEDIQPYFREVDAPAPSIEELANSRLPRSQAPEEPKYSDICAYLRKKEEAKQQEDFERALRETALYCKGGKCIAGPTCVTVAPPRRKPRRK